MSYAPIQVKTRPNTHRLRTVTPFEGENLRQFVNLLQPANAIRIVNYLPDAEGKLPKRKGLSKIFSVAGTNPVTMLRRYTSNQLIFGYGTTVAVYNETTGVITNIKTNFSANTGFNGVKYGDYFFVCNGVEKIWRIFTDLTITEVAASPICKVLNVLGARLLAGNLSTDATAVKYSELDVGGTPPFTVWDVGTTATQGGLVQFRNAGNVNDIATMGNVIVVFSDFGKWAFQIDLQNTTGVTYKVDTTVIDRRDLGGKKALMTKKAVFYVNKGGLWQLQSLGQPNIPYSTQEDTVSYILGRDYFPNIDFTGSQLAYDEVNEILFISCRDGATQNNYVFAYNTKTGAFSRISGWNIGVFFTDIDGTIWGGSSVATKVYKCFQGSDDDGLQIGTEYFQELAVGDFQTTKSFDKFAIQADISVSTQLTITFDIYDYQARYRANTASYLFRATNIIAEGGGYGIDSFGGTSYGDGGVTENSSLLPMFDSFKPGFRNFQRVQLHITSADTLPHTINEFIADISESKDIRKRNITIIST